MAKKETRPGRKPSPPTPKRWTPSRRPVWFDKQDVSRVADHLRGFFRSLPLNIQYMDAPHVAMFFRIPKNPEFRLDIRTRRTWNAKEAKRCLDYLGFPKDFSDAYLTMYGTGENSKISTRRRFTSWLWEVWFGQIRSLNGDALRQILTPDKKSAAKWNDRLRTCEATWAKVKVPDRAIRRITSVLFREVHGIELDDAAIESRLRMTAKKP